MFFEDVEIKIMMMRLRYQNIIKLWTANWAKAEAPDHQPHLSQSHQKMSPR